MQVQAADAPLAAPPNAHVSMSEHADEASSGTLPPIGGGGGHQSHAGGVTALKIDSKSLMSVGTNKGAPSGGAGASLSKMKQHGQHKVPGKQSGFKGPATHPKGGLVGSAVAGSAVQMQSRSCASCGDVLDFGVGGTSAQHASQPSMEPDSGARKKTYHSPYKQPRK